MHDPEVESFNGLWPGGYFEGDPMDRHARSHYGALDMQNGYPDRPVDLAAEEMGYVSILYAVYLTTIRHKLPPNAVVLEIGPGRGGWTKALLSQEPKFIYALDALPAEHNGFWDYIGPHKNVNYHQVSTFDCESVPDGSIDFFYSFGVFCHISRRGTAEYFTNIARKMKSGATGYCMISDYGKMSRALGRHVSAEEHQDPLPGRWFHLGTDWFCAMLEERGFEILDRDIETLIRDPMVQFRRR